MSHGVALFDRLPYCHQCAKSKAYMSLAAIVRILTRWKPRRFYWLFLCTYFYTVVVPERWKLTAGLMGTATVSRMNTRTVDYLQTMSWTEFTKNCDCSMTFKVIEMHVPLICHSHGMKFAFPTSVIMFPMLKFSNQISVPSRKHSRISHFVIQTTIPNHKRHAKIAPLALQSTNFKHTIWWSLGLEITH